MCYCTLKFTLHVYYVYPKFLRCSCHCGCQVWVSHVPLFCDAKLCSLVHTA